MRKIINGRSYDTTTAKHIGEWENTYDVRDHKRTHEVLLRKRNGEYFIYGQSGPAGAYAKKIGYSSYEGGDGIVPLSFDEAREWAERHLEADEYEAAFGEVSEGDEVMVSLRVSAQARAALDTYCARTGRKKGEVVSDLLMQLAQA